MKKIKTPISDEEISELQIGDKISLSGVMYTGRDAALPQLVELIKKGKSPIDTNGIAIMHTAVSDAGIAPTTSNKEEIESTNPFLSKKGVKIHIGKGMLNNETKKALYCVTYGRVILQLSKSMIISDRTHSVVVNSEYSST